MATRGECWPRSRCTGCVYTPDGVQPGCVRKALDLGRHSIGSQFQPIASPSGHDERGTLSTLPLLGIYVSLIDAGIPAPYDEGAIGKEVHRQRERERD